MRRLLIGIALIASNADPLLATEAPAAQNTGDSIRHKICGTTVEDRERRFSRVAEGISNFSSKVERVPPETARYFDAEYADALSSENRGRFGILFGNPLFHAWKLNKEFKAFSQIVQTGLPSSSLQSQSKRAQEIDRYITALEAPFSIAEAFDEYVQFDSKRKPSVFSEQDAYKFGVVQAFFQHEVHSLAVCAAE